MNDKIELGLRVRDEAFEGNPNAEDALQNKVIETLLKLIPQGIEIDAADAAVVQQFLDKRALIKQLTSAPL